MGKNKQGQVGMGQRSLAQETWRRFKRNRLAIAGMVFIGVLLAISVITVILDLVKPELYNNLVVKNDLLNKLAKPSPEHILGCDEYGRDLLFRILWGTRYSLFAGVVTILAAILVGGDHRLHCRILWEDCGQLHHAGHGHDDDRAQSGVGHGVGGGAWAKPRQSADCPVGIPRSRSLRGLSAPLCCR